MDRIDQILTKIDAIVRINNGELALMNERVAVTTTLNNVLRTLIDVWPVRQITEERAAELAPILHERLYGMDKPERIGRSDIQHCIDEGLEDAIPFLLIRYLMRHRSIRVHIRFTTAEWSEFINLNRPFFNMLGKQLTPA